MKYLIGLLFLISFPIFAKTLVIIGDSLTEGYGVSRESAFPAVIETLIQGNKQNWKVVNSGISGATTASAKGRVEWIMKTKPDLVLLVLGANDGLRGLNVKESQKNLSQAIERLQAQKVPVVLGGLYVPPNYGKDYAKQFKKMYLDLSVKYKIKLIPFVLETVAGDPKYNLADGIHPNEEGHKIIAGHIYKEIKGML